MSQLPREIEIVVEPDGTLRAEVKGVAGPSCADILRFLDALGVVVERRRTSDWDATEAMSTSARKKASE